MSWASMLIEVIFWKMLFPSLVYLAWWWGRYLLKYSLIKHTCSGRDNSITLWILNKQAKIVLCISLNSCKINRSCILKVLQNLNIGEAFNVTLVRTLKVRFLKVIRLQFGLFLLKWEKEKVAPVHDKNN